MFCIFVSSEQNPQTNRFLGSLLDFMYLEVPTFPWGEFNSVLDPDLDRIHPPSYQEKAPSTSAGRSCATITAFIYKHLSCIAFSASHGSLLFL